jgi:hypothetical protein
MAKFLLEIETGNEGMSSEFDIARALNHVSKEIESVGMLYHERYTIKDINGNTVGFYKVVP